MKNLIDIKDLSVEEINNLKKNNINTEFINKVNYPKQREIFS